MKALDRFWRRCVKPNGGGCWLWTGTKSRSGYGVFWIEGKNKRAHRVSYEIHKGQIPTGSEVCHCCDNRACVNPDHLFLGTHADNVADMIKKGRHARGSGKRSAKLTEADVLNIIASPDVPALDLAQRYGVSRSRISLIRSGKSWAHLKNNSANKDADLGSRSS
jgi:hypothetical protein